MPDWGLGIISSLVSAITVLAGTLAWLRRKESNGCNPGNGVKSLDKEFSAQVDKCNERWFEVAEERGSIKASLANIESAVSDIKRELSKGRG